MTKQLEAMKMMVEALEEAAFAHAAENCEAAIRNQNEA